MKKRLRLPVSAPQENLQSPFFDLSISGLPDGPAHAEKPVKKCGAGRLMFRKEKARRGGKSVVVVSGFDPAFPQEAIEDLAREVRRQCGCGGTVGDRVIEFQGDEPERFRKIFRDLL